MASAKIKHMDLHTIKNSFLTNQIYTVAILRPHVACYALAIAIYFNAFRSNAGKYTSHLVETMLKDDIIQLVE